MSRRAHTHKHTHRSKEHTNTTAGDHFAITPLGDFQVSLADLLQLFNQIELMAVAKKKTMAVITIGFCEKTRSPWTTHAEISHMILRPLYHTNTHSNTTMRYCTHTYTHWSSQTHTVTNLHTPRWKPPLSVLITLSPELHASKGDVGVIQLRKTVLSRVWFQWIICT